MPRYFFHVRRGDALVEDLEGMEIPDTESIEEEAMEAARDLLAEGDLQGLDRREWAFEVVGETGAAVMSLPFSDAVEPDLPEAEDSQP